MIRSRAVCGVVFGLLALFAAGCREEGDVEITELTFNGVEQVDKGALLDALQTKRGSRFPWGRNTFFDRDAFQADLRRITAFYRDRGFPDARIQSFDVQLNEAQDEVRIIVDIVEGDPIRVAEVDLRGFDVLSDAELTALRMGLPLQPDTPLDRQLAVTSREQALAALRNKGYPYADVSMAPETAGPKRERIILTATPGTLAHFGEISIVGAASVGDQVVRRELTFEPGDLFTRDAMRDSQRRLYNLELFEFANVESVENREQELPEVPIRVTVAESEHRRVTTGFGYGSEEKARARLRWEHLNFFGGARQAGFEGRWSSLDRGVRLDYTEPYFLAPKLSLRFEGQAWQAKEPVYAQNTLGGRAILRYQPSEQNLFSVSIINEYQRSTIANEALTDFTIRDELIALGLDPRNGVTQGTLGAVALEATRDTSDSLFDARRGYVLTGRVEQAGGAMWGSYNYWMLTGGARHYLPIAGRAVLANKLNLGAIDPSAGDDLNVPFHKRFFLGGSTSIRGWGRFELSPLSGFGFPIGGLSMIEGSSELRVPVWDKLGAVLFFDYGNVWLDKWTFDLDDLRYTAGTGLRYLTPVGPARIDFGYQLNPIDNLLVDGEPQKHQFRIHFSIGQAF